MKDIVVIERDGNFFIVTVNGWVLFKRDYLLYDSEEEMLEQVHQDILSELKITEQEYQKQFTEFTID